MNLLQLLFFTKVAFLFLVQMVSCDKSDSAFSDIAKRLPNDVDIDSLSGVDLEALRAHLLSLQEIVNERLKLDSWIHNKLRRSERKVTPLQPSSTETPPEVLKSSAALSNVTDSLTFDMLGNETEAVNSTVPTMNPTPFFNSTDFDISTNPTVSGVSSATTEGKITSLPTESTKFRVNRTPPSSSTQTRFSTAYSTSTPGLPRASTSMPTLAPSSTRSSSFERSHNDTRYQQPLWNRLGSWTIAPPPFLFNNTSGCEKLTQMQLINLLKQWGTYNPDFMAWDTGGVRRFLSHSHVNQYEKDKEKGGEHKITLEKNFESLEKMIAELDLKDCSQGKDMKGRLYNITHGLRNYYRHKERSVHSTYNPLEFRQKRDESEPWGTPESNAGSRPDDPTDINFSSDSSSQSEQGDAEPTGSDDMDRVGTVHVYGCQPRGTKQEGYKRMCGACRAVRVMPSRFFPPYINEVICDSDRGCLYFYDYPHGKCKQKYLNFVVLENIGTENCQVWKKYYLNVRVCCECFVDELSFFSKYV